LNAEHALGDSDLGGERLGEKLIVAEGTARV
jgi:hypothetical protein